MIIQCIVAAACLLIVLSLPVAKTALGAALRRWGCFLFLLALVPSIFFGLLHQTMRSRTPWSFGRVLEEFCTFLIIAAIAYAVLAFRKRLTASGARQPKRIGMKQAVDPPGARPDLASFLRDQLRDVNTAGGEDHVE